LLKIVGLAGARHKLRRMTIQVAAIGCDGIVLASDKMFFAHAATGKDFDDQTFGSKIVTVSRHKVAYAFAGDWFSQDVAETVVAGMDKGQFDPAQIRESMARILTQRYGMLGPD
jgi:hypothetical protein